MFGDTQGVGFPPPPYQLPPIIQTFAYNRVVVLALEREMAEKLLPFGQEQESSSTSRLKAAWATMTFGGASSLLPVNGGARPPARLVCAEGAFTQSSFLTFFIVFQGRANRPDSSNSSQLQTDSFFCGSARCLSFPAVICVQHATRILLKRGGQGKRIMNYILGVCVNRNCKWCQMERKIELY